MRSTGAAMTLVPLGEDTQHFGYLHQGAFHGYIRPTGFSTDVGHAKHAAQGTTVTTIVPKNLMLLFFFFSLIALMPEIKPLDNRLPESALPIHWEIPQTVGLRSLLDMCQAWQGTFI